MVHIGINWSKPPKIGIDLIKTRPLIYSIEFHLMALIDPVQAPHKNAFHEIQNVCFLLTLVIIIVCPQNDGLFCLRLSGRCLKSDGLPASNVTPWQRSEQKGWKNCLLKLSCVVFFFSSSSFYCEKGAFAKVEMAWNGNISLLLRGFDKFIPIGLIIIMNFGVFV